MIILYDKEIDSEQAERSFPAYDIRPFQGFAQQGVIRIEFHDYGEMKLDTSTGSISASLPYTPFKFNLPEGLSEEELSSMRELLGIGSRRVIVIGSPSDVEFNEFIQAYNSLYGSFPYAQRPLLIIGFRQRRNENELRLLGSFSGQSIAVRSDNKSPLPNVASNNVLILNTVGELLKMYSVADVAIIGNDRNIFEPASQKAAVLYFEGNWQNNKEAKQALIKVGAAQLFSKENLEKLLADFSLTEKMAKKGLEAVEAYKKEVQIKAEKFGLQIIGISSQMRDKLISASPAVILDRPEAFSSAMGAQTSENQASSPLIPGTRKFGGIDFRSLPIVTQAMSNLSANISSSAIQNLVGINLDEEWQEIERMASSGITPSSERIKEYIQTSCAQENIIQDKDKILLCISDILRLEEERCDHTNPTLRDILVVLESMSNTQELRQVFLGKIVF